MTWKGTSVIMDYHEGEAKLKWEKGTVNHMYERTRGYFHIITYSSGVIISTYRNWPYPLAIIRIGIQRETKMPKYLTRTTLEFSGLRHSLFERFSIDTSVRHPKLVELLFLEIFIERCTNYINEEMGFKKY